MKSGWARSRAASSLVGRTKRKVFALVVVALFASVLVVAGPAAISTPTADAQVLGDPIDCDDPADDVLVIKTGEAITPGLIQSAPRVAFHPGRYEVIENLTLTNGLEITSCDPLNPAVLVNGGNATYTLRMIGDLNQRATAFIHDINFEILQFNGIVARDGVDLVVERVNIVADGRVLPSGPISSIIVTTGASAVLRDLAIDGPHRGISASRTGSIEMERVTVTDTLEFGVYIEGDSFDPAGSRPTVTIDDLQVLGASLPSGRGLAIGSGNFTIANSTIACSGNSNIEILPSAVKPDTSTFRLTDVSVGLDSCEGERPVGILSTGETALTMVGGLVTGTDRGVVFEESSGAKNLQSVKIAGNAIGIDSDQPVDLVQVTLSENGRDCRVTEGLITSDAPGANDGTCVANPGSNGIDCAVPPTGVSVLAPGDDLEAALKLGGLVLLEPGDHQVSVEVAIAADVELTSCDSSNPATLTRATACQRVLLFDGPPGVTAYVHHVDIDGGSAGLTARGGLNLVAEQMQIAGVQPYCDGDDRGLEISGGSTATIANVSVANYPWGVRVRETGDVSFTDVLVDRNDDWGIHIASANAPTAPRPRITLTRTTVTNTNRSGATGHGVLAISADLVIADSTFVCNQNSNIRAVSWDVATDSTVLYLNDSLVGRFADGTKCTEFVQTDGVRTSGLVTTSTFRTQIFDHNDTGIQLEGKSGVQAEIIDAVVENNAIGIEAAEPLRLQGSAVINNGADCLAFAGLIEDQGGNAANDGTCFEPAFTLAPAVSNDGFSLAEVAGQDVFRIERPIGLPGFPDTATFSEFVITAAEPAPVGGLFVEWTVAGSTFAGLPSADRSDILFEEQIARKRQVAPGPMVRTPRLVQVGWLAQVDQGPGDFVSSPTFVRIPEGETTVTIRMVPTIDFDPGEAIEIGLVNASATLQAVISPTDFDFDVVTPAEPLTIGAGDTGTIDVRMTPALPAFAFRDQVFVDWAVTGDGAAAPVAETGGTVVFDAEEDGALTSIRPVTITADTSVSETVGLTFGLDDGDSLNFEVTEAVEEPLEVIEIIPSDPNTISIDGADIEVLQLTPGDDSEGATVVLNRIVDRPTYLTVTTVGSSIGLARPVNAATDFEERPGGPLAIPAGEDRVFIRFEAALSPSAEDEFEPVEGFIVTASLSTAAALQSAIAQGTLSVDDVAAATPGIADADTIDSVDLPGIISPDAFRVDFRGPDHPDPSNVSEGDTLDITVVVTPADPYGDALSLDWRVGVLGADAELPTATEADFAGPSRSVDVAFSAADGDTAASMTETFTVEVVENDGDEDQESYSIELLPGADGGYTAGDKAFGLIEDVPDDTLTIEVLGPNPSLGIGLAGGGSIDTVHLTPGLSEQGFEVILSRDVTIDTQIDWSLVGAQVDVARPADASDFPATSGSEMVLADSNSVFVELQAIADLGFEPVEGFEVTVSLREHPAAPEVKLLGIIDPDSYRIDFTSPGTLEVDEGDDFEVTVTMTPANPYGNLLMVPWTLDASSDADDADFATTTRTFEVDFVVDVDDPSEVTRTFPVAIVENDGLEGDETFEINVPANAAPRFTGVIDLNGTIKDTAPQPASVVSVVPADGYEVLIPQDVGPTLPVLALETTNEITQGFVVELDRPAESGFELLVTFNEGAVGVPRPIDIESDVDFGADVVVDGDVIFGATIAVVEGESEIFVPLVAPVSNDREPVEGFEVRVQANRTPDLPVDAGASLQGIVQPDRFEVRFVQLGEGHDYVVGIFPASPYGDPVRVPWRVLPDNDRDPDASPEDFLEAAGFVLVGGDGRALSDGEPTESSNELVSLAIAEDEFVEPDEYFEIGLGLNAGPRLVQLTPNQAGVIPADAPTEVVSVVPNDTYALSIGDDAGPTEVLALETTNEITQGFVVGLTRPAEVDLELLVTFAGVEVGVARASDIETDLAIPTDPRIDGDAEFGAIVQVQAGEQEIFVPLAAPPSADREPVEGFEIRVGVNRSSDEPADAGVTLQGIIQPDSFEVQFDRLGPETVDEGGEIDFIITVLPGNPYGDPIAVPWTTQPDLTTANDASPEDFEVASGVVTPDPDSAAQSSGNLTLTIATDEVDEGVEVFEIGLTPNVDERLEQLQPNAGGIINGQSPTSYTILVPADDRIFIDGVPALELIPTEEARFFIVVDQPVTRPTEIAWSITTIERDGLDAATASDLLFISGIATIPADSDRVEVILGAAEDPTGDERAEIFQLTVQPRPSEPGGVAPDPILLLGVVQPQNVALDIIPAEAQGSVAQGSEASGLAFTVVMTPAYAFTQNLEYTWTIDGDGTFGATLADSADFAATSGTISFAHNPAEDTFDRAARRVDIAVVDDQEAEPDEGFALVLPQANKPAEVLLGYLVESPAGSPGDAPDPADDSVPFGGFKLSDPEGEVTEDENGTQGDISGRFKLPEWPDDIPITIAIRDGRATVTYDDTFDDVELGEPPFLRIVNPRVVATASAGLDGSMEAQITITADRAEFFPESDGGPIAVATDLTGVARSDGSITFTTDEVTGTFADLDVELSDVALVISDNPAIPLLSVGEVETVDGVEVAGIRVFRDGRIVIAELCVTDDADLVGRVGIAGLGFTLEEACLRTADNGTQTFDVTGIFDAELNVPGVGDIVSGVSVGADPDNEGQASFVLIDDGDGFSPETLGPINVEIGEFEVAGLTVEGEAEVAGWQNGLLDPAVTGDLNITGENLLLDTTDLTAMVNGSVTTTGTTTTLDLGATVAGDLSLADGLVVINEGELGLEISIESTTTESAGVASTEVTVDGPRLSALDLAATVTIPGLDDVDGDPVQVDAAITYDEGDESEGDERWVVTVEPTLASGWDFGVWSINEISGEIVLMPNAPVGERIDGELALLANVTTDTDDVVTQLSLEVNDTTTPGEFAISVDTNTTWSGSGIPGLVVVNGELDIDGSARVNLADPAFAVDSFAAVGSFDRATLALGDFLVDLEGATVSFDGDPATPLLEITEATASIADPDDPNEDLITLTIADLTIADDGSIAVGEVDVDNIDNLTDSFGLNGILPFTLERLVASFSEPGNFDTFSLRAVGEVDLGGIDDLDLRVAQGVGAVATCEGDPGSLIIPFDFTLAIESLSEGQIRPQNLESLSAAVCGVELAGFVGSTQIQLGGYRNGQLVPEVSGSITIESAEDNDSPLSGGVGISIGGRVVDNGNGARLLIDGRAEVSGAFDEAIVVEDAAFEFGFDVLYTESTNDLSIENARAGNGTVGLLRVSVDDVVTFEAENVSIYPEPSVLASFIGGSVGVSFGEDLDVLDGWGGSAGNFTVVTTQDGGLDVIVEPNFFVSITAPDEVDIGLPDWLPFTLTEAGLQWPVVTEPTSLFTLLEDIATAQVLISGGLVGSESGWPFDAQVDGLVVDLGILGDWLGGDFSQSPIVDLEGVLIGVAPRDWGPARVGGGLALGYVPGDNGEPVWYGRLFGEFAVDGFGLGLDMVVSEHGPIAASFQSPAAIPLDPSGLMLSGVSGGLDFSLGGRIPPLPSPDCESVDGGLVCPDGSSPLSLLTSSAYNFDTPRTWSLAQIQQAVRDQQARAGSWLPDVVTMYIGGDITHAVTAGAISGQVRLAATLDASTDATGLVLLGTGNVSIWGLGGGEDPGGIARAGLLLDLSDPINPQFTIAAEVPNGDDWLAAALPGQARFGMTLDTEGLAQGLALALQTFLAESVNNPAFDQLFFDYAQTLNANRSLRVAELLAVDPGTEITAALLRSELQALVSGGSNAPLAAQAVVADLLTLATNPLDSAAPGPLANQPLIISTGERPPPATAQAVLDALLDAAQEAAFELVDVADPKLLAEGQTQLKLLGVPFGSPQGARLFFSKNQFFFEAQGSVIDTLRDACIIPGCAQVLYLLSAGMTDTTTLGFGIPINPQSLIDGTAFTNFDPFTSPWRGTVGGSLTMFGFPLANVNGVMLGGGQPDAVDQELDSGRYTIAVPPGARSAMEEFGGLLVEANLQLPGFITDPGERLAELGNADCFQFPDGVGEIPAWFGRCVDETTAADTIGAVQVFAPLPPFPGTCEDIPSTCPQWAVDQMYARGEFDGSILGLPLGSASIEANAAGFTVTAKPPLVPDTSTTEWNFAIGSREIDDGQGGTNSLPTVGLEAGLTSDDLTLLLREFGLDDLIDLSAVDADISVRAYTPGYDPDGDALQQQGGIEIEAMASIENVVEEVAFSFSLTPRASFGADDLLPFNVIATATVTNATIAGIEVRSGLISISVIDDVVSVTLEIEGSVGEFDVTGELLGTVSSSGLSGSFVGQVTLPAGLGDTERASFAATGSLRTNGDFTLTLDADEVELGPLAIDGNLSLRRRSNTITFEIGQSRVELQGPNGSVLVSGRTRGISVSSDGQMAGDITFNRIGSADFIALEGLTARLVADFSSDDSQPDIPVGRDDLVRRGSGLGITAPLIAENEDDIVFDLAIESGDVVLGFLSGATGADAPRLSGPDLRLLIERDGDFSLSTEMEALDLGILELDRSTAALTFEDRVLTFEADFGASVPIGDNDPSRVSVRDLSINSLGQVSGQLSGSLNLFDSRLASVSATLSSPPGKPGVIRIGDINAQLGGGSFQALMGRFTGHFDTDGTVDLTASLDIDVDMSIGPIPIAAVEGTGSVRVTNSGAVASVTDGSVSVFLFSCSGIEVELGVYVNPVGLAGSASLCDRFLEAEFAWPAEFEPPITSSEPTWIYLPTSVDLGVFSLTRDVTIDYDLPIARNGTVECSPAPGTQLAIVVGSLTASCTATSPTGQEISGEFELLVEELPTVTTGPAVGGGLDGLTVGGVSLDDEPDAVVTAAPSIMIQLQDDLPKTITTTPTSKGEAVEADKGDEFAGVTKALPGTVVTGKLRSDPLEVFSVIADVDGNAEWRFAIPDDFPAGEHSLVITGIGVDVQSFASVVPLFIEEDVVQVFDPILPSPPDAGEGALEAVTSATSSSTAGSATAGSSAAASAGQSTTGGPLAHTGFAGQRLAMLGLWLVLIGSFTMGTRRSLSGRDASRRH